MREPNNLKKQLLSDISLAQKQFECYEDIYVGINGNGKKYLQIQSAIYKKTILDVQKLIQPVVGRICPTCEKCCKINSPEVSVYTARAFGCFDFIDYILARCDTVLPVPNFKNMQNNYCAFWLNGCILPDDCRSLMCINFFCDEIKKEFDMNVISEHLEILQSFIQKFSIQKCLGLETQA